MLSSAVSSQDVVDHDTIPSKDIARMSSGDGDGSVSPETHTTFKESPLTDIAVSPPSFELSDNDKRNSGTILSPKQNSDDSSELSDLEVADSEAETDKMDFLEENGHDSVDNDGSDLNTLSKLTELARLKDVDSDLDDEDLQNLPKKITHEDPDLDPEPETNSPGSSNEIDDQISTKRHLDDDDDDSRKKQKTSSETGSDKSSSLEPNGQQTDSKPDQASGKGQVEVKDELDGQDESDNNEDTNTVKKSQEESGGNSPNNEVVEPKKIESVSSSTEQGEDIKEDVKEDVEEDVEEDEDVEEAIDVAEDGEGGENDEKEDGDHEDEIEVDAEAEAEVEEEDEEDVDMNEQRKMAIEELVSIEESFAELRDKLYHDKLNLLEHELQLCLEGSHPELSKICLKFNEFYEDNLRLANANLSYKLKCIDKETIATRTSIHQNFMKNLIDGKNELITQTTSKWYQINRERNQIDQLVADYNFCAIPNIPNFTTAGPVDESITGNFESPLTKKAIKQNTIVELVQQRNNVNHQLGILNGLIEFHGFPSAISSSLSESTSVPGDELLLRTATQDEINEDLAAMGIPI
jgi:hypothetical protein